MRKRGGTQTETRKKRSRSCVTHKCFVCVSVCAVDDTIINKEDEKKRKKKRVLLFAGDVQVQVLLWLALMSVCSVVQRCVLQVNGGVGDVTKLLLLLFAVVTTDSDTSR